MEAAAKLIGEAKTGGADYVQTPEMTNILEVSREKLFATIVPEEQDASLATFRELARALGIYVHVGSLAIKASADKAVNRSFLIDRRGEIVARYDKIHMFDVDLKGGESYRESRSYRPGDLAVLTDLPWGRLGLTICYDLRFPALYRALAEAGATFLAIPSAFTKQTGEAHWHVLMRARAIENGSFVFAAAQGGDHENGRCDVRPFAGGRSMGTHPRRRRDRTGRRVRRHRSGGSLDRAQPHPVVAAWPALRNPRADGGADAPARCRSRRVIHYSLVCQKGHDFDSWFASSAAYDKQVKRGLISCPLCGSAKVEKAIMAPRLARRDKSTPIVAPVEESCPRRRKRRRRSR